MTALINLGTSACCRATVYPSWQPGYSHYVAICSKCGEPCDFINEKNLSRPPKDKMVRGRRKKA